MPLVLAIEISNPSAWTASAPVRPGVAVATLTSGGAILLGSEAIDPTRIHDDDLMPAIQRLFASRGLLARDIARIAVSVGPGGFTATRIAVTAAKLIAEATGAQCIAVPSASVAHAAAKPAGDSIVALSSKGESLHATRFTPAGEVVGAPQILNASDVDLNGALLLIADRFTPPSLVERAQALGVMVAEPVFDPVALLGIEHGFEACSPIDLAPIYPREPEAVTKWRELKRLGKK